MSSAVAMMGRRSRAAAPASACLCVVGLVIWIAMHLLRLEDRRTQGLPPWLGLLLGILLSWIGLIIVAVLPEPERQRGAGGRRVPAVRSAARLSAAGR